MKTWPIFICLLVATVCSGVKLPASFKKCSRSLKKDEFNECLTKAVDDAIKQLDKPFNEVNLPSLEPLEVPALTIGAGSGPVGVTQNFKNFKVYGFTKHNNNKFEFDLEKKTARMEGTFPEVKILTDYKLNGKILLLPVHGEGPATIIMENLRGVQTFVFEEYEKKGKKHLRIIDGNLTLNPGLVRYNFENLFDGDKSLGDNINKVINENWSEVFTDVKASYEDAFGQIIKNLYNNLLAKVSLEEHFDE